MFANASLEDGNHWINMQPGCSFAVIIESVIRNIDIQFATVNVLNSKKRDETNELKGRGVSYLKDEDEKIEISLY